MSGKKRKKIAKLKAKVEKLQRDVANLRMVVDADERTLRAAYEANVEKNRQIRRLQDELDLFL